MQDEPVFSARIKYAGAGRASPRYTGLMRAWPKRTGPAHIATLKKVID